MLLANRTPWPARIPVKPRRRPSLQGPDEVIATLFGHTTFSSLNRDGNILTDHISWLCTDPFDLRQRAANTVARPGVREPPVIAVVLISHNHSDYCEPRTLQALDRQFEPLRTDCLLKSVASVHRRTRLLGRRRTG